MIPVPLTGAPRAVFRALVAVALVSVAASCGSEPSTSTSATTTTTTTTRALDLSGGNNTTTAQTSPTDAPTTLNDEYVSPLAAGTYIPGPLSEPLTFTVGDGWHLVQNYVEHLAMSTSPTANFEFGAPSIAVVDLAGFEVIDPPYAVSALERLGLEDRRLPLPDDVAGWMANLEWFETGPVETTTLDGIEADTFTYRVEDLPDELFTDELGLTMIDLFVHQDGGAYVFGEHNVGRIWILPRESR